ncbi:hypothetical protein PPSIR1_03083 [Plesiocystis pacifica SIR-1]|uniref:DUF1554 domain-containing protein n=2 Tax=Plesiocystis pacifica TaxID=191768 RepID=A6G987_9BACT|nr:hypothetical protein PPSIR1_03083 [Plesiocystis pacifica SIR-1]
MANPRFDLGADAQSVAGETSGEGVGEDELGDTSSESSAEDTTAQPETDSTASDDECPPGELACDGSCVPAGTQDHCEGCEPCDGLCVDGTCHPEQAHLVFVTSVEVSGNFQGIQGGDEFCAIAAGLGDGLPEGPWLAWLGDGRVSTADAFGPGSVFVRVDGVVIAEGLEDLLDGELDAPINLTEAGHPLPGSLCDQKVWTGLTPEGDVVQYDCQGWTTGGAQGTVGSAHATDAQWAEATSCGLHDCHASAALYCIHAG